MTILILRRSQNELQINIEADPHNISTNIRVTTDMDEVSTLPNKLIADFADEKLMNTAG